MDSGVIMKIIFNVIGGLGIFLLGMHHLSNGLQMVAGARLKWLIGKVTNNRFMAAGVGTLVTTIVQSSSITTVMVVGFVNAGLMTLIQAIGVIMGANIGTTITGWIIAIKIGKYGLPILGVAAIYTIFAKDERRKYIATAILGLGMVFFGLELMKNGFKPIRSIPEFVEAFKMVSAATPFGVLKCILIGAVLTMIVQSSSATLGITIGLATTGVIPFTTAAALVLGENIGTTITAFLASFGAKTNAKRAAYAHVFFNVLGVTVIFFLFRVYIAGILNVIKDPSVSIVKDGVIEYPNMAAGIAMVHTGFNVVNTFIFIWLIKPLASMLEKLVPDTKEEVIRVTQLDRRMLETPMMVVDQVSKEIDKMGSVINEMFGSLNNALTKDLGKADNDVKLIFDKEEDMDIRQKEISEIILELLAEEHTHIMAVGAKQQLSYSDEYESISDYIMALSKHRLKLKDNDLSLNQEKIDDLSSLHNMVQEYFDFVNEAILKDNKEIVKDLVKKNSDITQHFKAMRAKHMERVSQSKVDPLLSTTYMDMLNAYRRIKDHIYNVGEVLTGDK